MLTHILGDDIFRVPGRVSSSDPHQMECREFGESIRVVEFLDNLIDAVNQGGFVGVPICG